ncbi:MAG: hypothetical protein ACRDR6_01505 [Pseudonocardiaceae bacterium]
MLFIGRGVLLNEILGSSGDRFSANDLFGGLGAGKTAILQRLEDQARVRPFRVNIEDFNPGHDGDHGRDASLGAVQASFQQFCALLTTLVRWACPQDTLARFQGDVVAARHAEVENVRLSSLEESMHELRFQGELQPQNLAEAWRSAQTVVAEKFVSYWNAAPTTSRMLLIDNIDEVSDQEIGAWLGELLPRLDRTIVVFTRTPAWFPLHLSTDAVRVFEIVDFDESEVREYLDTAARQAGREPVTRSIEEKIYEISQGRPATLAAVYELIRIVDAAPGADLLEFLDDLPERPDEKAAALVERLVRDDEALERALWAAAVPRRFNALLLEDLLGHPPLSPADQRRVFDALARFKFTEKLSGDFLRLHSYVRNGLFQRLSRTAPRRFDAFHARAAEHYGRELTAEGNRYGEAFIYEDPVWQRGKREWLYHRGHATSKDAREKALLDFTRVFLDAFWWWGSYIHFDFCDQLIADLGRLAAQQAAPPWPDLATLHQALRCIVQKYPLRSVQFKDAEWADIRAALLTVQSLCGLQDHDPRTKDERHVEALLRVFLAHTWRYQACERPEADQDYKRAAELFARDDDWSEPWVAFERADLRLERNEADAVPDLWREAASLVQPHEVEDKPDEELISNLHRLRGDCCWASGEQARSATWYGRAVLHAYLFHVVGGPPDDYTLQFYVDIRARALSRLFEVWPEDQNAAVQLATEMARAFPSTHGREPPRTPDRLRELLGDDKPVPLAHALFPRGPEVWELGSKDSPFTQELNTLVNALFYARGSQRAWGDLHDSTWP